MNDDHGPLPTIHPRHVPCEMARRKLDAFLTLLRQEHDLTAAEYLSLIVNAAHTDIQWLIRAERKDG